MLDLSTRPPGAILCMPGRNAKPYLDDAFRAIAAQTVQPKAILILDDASEDGTTAEAERLAQHYGLQQRTLGVQNTDRLGKVHSVYQALKAIRFHSDDVIVMHDLDDYLSHSSVLARMMDAFTGGWDVVYSNHELLSDPGKKSFCAQLDPFLTARRQDWLTSHLFSFKAPLFDAITPEHCRGPQGDWMPFVGDMVFAFLVTDQTPYIRYVDEIWMVYRDNLTVSHGNNPQGRANQLAHDKFLRTQKPPFEKTFRDDAVSLGRLMELKSLADLRAYHRAIQESIKRITGA